MEENKLLLITEEQVEKSAIELDNLVDWDFIKNGVIKKGAEAFDGKAFKLALSGINNSVSAHIPDEYKDEFQLALNDVLDGDKDYTETAEQFFLVAESLVEKLAEKGVSKSIISSVKIIIEMIATFANVILENIAEK